ncbi:hypothetical protein H696_01520 [Fonticula alba]|uniref:Smr domain-containing protein n=1 Tax=Fonticula alba TaxID=691883 RepID=A0A058ZCK7_FONAL|nr:hypothetical protein H696_01520 [Fonticula alba]KCV72114.1 hypothetical protein H696_01520 [Fonticula alba]|eukprot:XP_009493692.1 hypothetical protein H696_01520 [Fonticula alba]
MSPVRHMKKGKKSAARRGHAHSSSRSPSASPSPSSSPPPEGDSSDDTGHSTGHQKIVVALANLFCENFSMAQIRATLADIAQETMVSDGDLLLDMCTERLHAELARAQSSTIRPAPETFGPRSADSSSLSDEQFMQAMIDQLESNDFRDMQLDMDPDLLALLEEQCLAQASDEALARELQAEEDERARLQEEAYEQDFRLAMTLHGQENFTHRLEPTRAGASSSNPRAADSPAKAAARTAMRKRVRALRSVYRQHGVPDEGFDAIWTHIAKLPQLSDTARLNRLQQSLERVVRLQAAGGGSLVDGSRSWADVATESASSPTPASSAPPSRSPSPPPASAAVCSPSCPPLFSSATMPAGAPWPDGDLEELHSRGYRINGNQANFFSTTLPPLRRFYFRVEHIRSAVQMQGNGSLPSNIPALIFLLKLAQSTRQQTSSALPALSADYRLYFEHYEELRDWVVELRLQHILATCQRLAPGAMAKIDLHGLDRIAAMDILRQVISRAPTSRIEVVTGRGSHSVGNVPVIKTAVISYLKQAGIRHSLRNDGSVMVNLA